MAPAAILLPPCSPVFETDSRKTPSISVGAGDGVRVSIGVGIGVGVGVGVIGIR